MNAISKHFSGPFSKLWYRFIAFVADVWYPHDGPDAVAPKPEASKHPDTPGTRAAVHESGHALAAWFCTAVTEVQSVSIDFTADDPRAGLVVYRLRDAEAHRWCEMVVKLAGVAAEILVFGRFASAQAESDLVRARKLAETAEAPPDWIVRHGSTLPFSRLFTEPLTMNEQANLTWAYRTARALLVSRALAHTSLVSALLHRRRLGEQDLAHVLGHRTRARLLGPFTAKFIY